MQPDFNDEIAARTVARQCIALGQAHQCETFAVWAPGKEVGEVSEHDWDAIKEFGRPAVLTYLSEADKRAELQRRWYASDPTCATPTSTERQACDEYPYYSTEEGSRQAHLKMVNLSQNSSEGSKRQTFTNTCKMGEKPRYASQGELNPDRQYVVIPIYMIGVDTLAWCGPNRTS